MGLFSSKKTYVSSTVFNMAGDIENRYNYLKTLVISHVITDNGDKSLGSSLTNGYLKGPGLRLKSFGLWSQNNYPAVGQIKSQIYSQAQLDDDLLFPLIPKDPNETVAVRKIEILPADYSYWAEQWMMENYPEELGSMWISDANDVTNEIDITRENGVVISINPQDYDPEGMYVYAVYNLVRASESEPIIEGPLVILEPEEAYPSVGGWTNISNISNTVNVTLNKVTKTTVSYSDGRPSEIQTVNSNSVQSYEYYKAVFEKNNYQGSTGDTGSLDEVYSIKEILNLNRDHTVIEKKNTTTSSETIGGGVTKITKVEVTEDTLNVIKSYKLDTQRISLQSYSPAKMLIYKIGSGNAAIDMLASEKSDDGFYFPFIPVRIDNKMVDSNNYSDVRVQNERAYKKLTGNKRYQKDIVEKVASNESIKEMDYVYIMLGVSLNSKENTAKQYLFDFFERLRLTQKLGTGAYAAWKEEQLENEADAAVWSAWRAAQANPASALFGTPAPALYNAVGMPSNMIRIKGNGTLSNANLDMEITWQSIIKNSGTGLIKAGAKRGDYFVDYGGNDLFPVEIYNQGITLGSKISNVDRLFISHQMTDNSWETIEISGLVHRNHIYKKKSVEIDAKEAMNDTEESGFLVPIHYETFKKMSLVDSTQLSTACCYLVVNSYKVVKTGFFQSTFFKILLVVAIVAITIVTAGTTAGFSAGVLGSSAVIGATLGLTGTLALIVGAIANTIAAMIISKLLTYGATLVLGDKLGAIIGGIASVVALNVGTALASGASLAASFAPLMRVDNILQLTSAVGSGVSGYVQAGAMETSEKTQQLVKDYEKKSEEISKKYEEIIGYDRAKLDPLLLLSNGSVLNVESGVTFLQRTLMTGSDVAELSLSMLSNFTEITLSTDLNL